MPHHTPLITYNLQRRIKNRMEKIINHIIDQHDLNNEIAEKLKIEFNKITSQQFEEFNCHLEEKWHRIASQPLLIDDLLHKQNKVNNKILEMENRLIWRLGEIENRLDSMAVQCRYAEASNCEGLAGTASLITLKVNHTGNNNRIRIEPDENKLIDKLNSIAQNARVLVLVDPYALSDKNDSGNKSSFLDQIERIYKNCSIAHTHLYVQKDVTSYKIWRALEDKLEKKITVHIGDIHDRYMLAGSDKIKGEEIESWHGFDRWNGVVFGASLNGISKRPTYVLKFEHGDIANIKAYLTDCTKIYTIAEHKEFEDQKK